MMKFIPVITAASVLLSGDALALPSVYESAEVMWCVYMTSQHPKN